MLVIVAPALAEKKIILLTDGRRLVGEITETADGYLVKLAYGEVPFKKAEVVKIMDIPKSKTDTSFEDRYAKVDKTDPTALYDLASWAWS